MKKISSTSHQMSKLKVKTALSLSKTKPLKAGKMRRLQNTLRSAKPAPQAPEKARIKPVSQIETRHKTDLWMIPARVAYFLNGIYFLGFSIVSFLGLFSNYKLIQPFFTLPFDTTFSSFFLLENAAFFSFLVSLMFMHAARHPRSYRWFYFLLIILVFPFHFLSNFQKLQIELPADFQNYLYFDTIVMAVLWAAFLVSLLSYLKPNQSKK